VAGVAEGPTLLAEFAAASGLEVVDFSQAAELVEAARRMRKYLDLPMDYADATLVLLAERTGVFDVLTLDRRGFSVYRSARGRHFSLVLD
jgi:predicted nucleic acid-binding protein